MRVQTFVMCWAIGLLGVSTHHTTLLAQQISPALFELGAQQFQAAYFGRVNSLDPQAEQTFDLLRGQMSYLFFGFNSNPKPINRSTSGRRTTMGSYYLSWNLRPVQPSNEVNSFHTSELLRQDSSAVFQIGYKNKRIKLKGDPSYPSEFRVINWGVSYGMSNHRLVMPATRLSESVSSDSIFQQSFTCHALTLSFEWAPMFMLNQGGSLNVMNLRQKGHYDRQPSAFAFIVRPHLRYLYLQNQDSLDLKLDRYLGTRQVQAIQHLLLPGIQIDFNYEIFSFFVRSTYPVNIQQVSNKLPGLGDRGPDFSFGIVYIPGISARPKHLLHALKGNESTELKQLNENLNRRLNRLRSQAP